jgi:hypothetical protein
MGLAMGSALLTSCGGGGGGSAGSGNSGGPPTAGTPGQGLPAPLPNGYVQAPVYNTGGALPDGTFVMAAAEPTPTNIAFNGVVHLNNRGGELFSAYDSNGVGGLYQATLDYSANSATTRGAKLILKEEPSGVLYPANTIVRPPGNPAVSYFGTGSTNDDGVLLLKVTFADGRQGLYVDSGGGVLEPLFYSFQDIPGQSVTLGHQVSATCTVHKGNDTLFVADFTRADESQAYQGLFFLPQGRLSESQVLLATGDLLPQSSAIVQSLSLSYFNDGLQYVVQGTAQVPGAAVGGTFSLTGQVGGSQRLLSASPNLGASEGVVGEIFFAPRIGPMSAAAKGAGLGFRDKAASGQTAVVVHTDPDTVALAIDGNVVLRGGGPEALAGTGYLSLSPRGDPIFNINPPCFGSDGHIFFQLTTSAGFELVSSNGAELRTLLGSGDVIDGKTVSAVIMGGVPDQVDDAGHVTFAVEYSDFSSGLIVACPL